MKQISDNEIYLLIKYIKSVLWRVAKRLSYIEDAWCLKGNVGRYKIMNLREGGYNKGYIPETSPNTKASNSVRVPTQVTQNGRKPLQLLFAPSTRHLPWLRYTFRRICKISCIDGNILIPAQIPVSHSPIYKSHGFVSNYILFYIQFCSLFVLVDVTDIVFQDKYMLRVVRFSREKRDTAPVMMTIENSREKQDNIVLHMGAIAWETPRRIL